MKILGYQLKHLINPVRWYRAIKYKLFGQYVRIKKDDLLFVSELVVYRSGKCWDCAAAGKCKSCKCPTSELFSTPELDCDLNKWESMTKEEWEHFKSSTGLKVKATRN